MSRPWTRTRTIAAVAAVAIILASGSTPPLGAQVTVEPASPCPDPERGSLGITGFRCDHCSFSRDRSGFTRAEFLTEPEVFRVDAGATEGDDLRVGDVLVAVDGALITTDAGARRFTSLAADEWVRLTVRRDGRTRELRIRTARACDVTPPPPPSPRPLLPPVADETSPPALPPVAGAPSRPDALPPDGPAPLPPLPTPPSAPGASLGFGLECGRCTYRSRGGGSSGSWRFDEAPRLYQVREGGPAWAAGLRGGDVLEEIDGVALTTPEGGRRFAAVTAGQEVVWTVRRGGRRLHVTTVPEARETPAAESGAGPLRYTGTVGDAEVEVRGGAVTVREEPGERLVVIRSGDVVVVIRRRDGAG